MFTLLFGVVYKITLKRQRRVSARATRICFLIQHLRLQFEVAGENIHERVIHSPGGNRTRNPNNRAAADPRLRPRGYWDRLL